MKPIRAGYTIFFVSLLCLEICLHLPFFEKRLTGLGTLLSEYRHFAYRKETDELYPSKKMFDPILGWRAGPKITRSAEREHINAQGWRSRTDFSPTKTKIRIAVLGDSFLFGQNINDEDTIHYRLQELLGSDFEVYNFAVDGYSWDQIYAVAVSEIPKYSPDLIIIGIIKNDLDLERNCLGFAWGRIRKPYFRVENGIIFSKNTPLPTPQEALTRNSTLIASIRNKSISLISEVGIFKVLGVFVTRYFQKECWDISFQLLEDLVKKYPLNERLIFAALDTLPDYFLAKAKKLPLFYVNLIYEEKRLGEKMGVSLDTTDGFHPGKNTNNLGAIYLSKLIRERFRPKEH